MGQCYTTTVRMGPANPNYADKVHIPLSYEKNTVKGYVHFPPGHLIKGTFNNDWGYPWHGTIQLAEKKEQEAHFCIYPWKGVPSHSYSLCFGNYLVGQWGNRYGIWKFGIRELPQPMFVVSKDKPELLETTGGYWIWSAELADSIAKELYLKTTWKGPRIVYSPQNKGLNHLHYEAKKSLSKVVEWINNKHG